MIGTDATLQEAAELLGVHYMTAYRYVRLGLLNADKVGGMWRVSKAELDRFQEIPPPAHAANGSGDGRRKAPWAERLEGRLAAGDSTGAWGVIEAALAAGSDLDEIYLDVLAPAMRSIGARWSVGEIDIAIEHRASVIAMRLIGRIGPRFVRRGRTRGAVVVGAPAGERHALPISLVADLARRGGWEVSDLGADVPAASFVTTVEQTDGVICVGIGVTTSAHLPAAAAAIEGLRGLDRDDLLLVAGGLAVESEEHALSLGARAYASDGRQFTSLLDQWTSPSTHRTHVR